MLARLAALPAVMRFVGDGAPWPRRRADELSARVLVHWRAHGFGWRARIQRETGRAVGADRRARPSRLRGGRSPPATTTRSDGGSTREAWGRGDATEGGRAIVAEAFDRLRAPSVVARVKLAIFLWVALVCAALGLDAGVAKATVASGRAGPHPATPQSP